MKGSKEEILMTEWMFEEGVAERKGSLSYSRVLVW